MKHILAVTFAATALLLSSCAHMKSCCADKKAGSCCSTDKKSMTDECKTCDAGAKPGTVAKKGAQQH